MAEYHAQRANGGAGFIVAEGILVSRQGCVILYRSDGGLLFFSELRGLMPLGYGTENKLWFGRR